MALSIGALAWLSLNTATKAPALQLTAIDIDGHKFSTNDFRGKVLMISFWETSCTTCIEDADDLCRQPRGQYDQTLPGTAFRKRSVAAAGISDGQLGG
jgi:peroxiredoxin